MSQDAMNQDVHIRWMVPPDKPAVMEIERECFNFPWSEKDLVRCLQQRNCVGMVAEIEDDAGHSTIVGFMIYELHKTRINLLDFAVAKARWRTGIGRAMAEKLKEKLGGNRPRVTMSVRETNMDALLFFKAMGFRATSILRGFYEESDDDAIVMQFRRQAVTA